MNGQPDHPADETEFVAETSETIDPEQAEEAEQDANPETPLADLQAKADENWDRYLRAAAETENVRKRAARDVEHARRYALEAFAKEMLAVRDSFEALSSFHREQMIRAFDAFEAARQPIHLEISA